MLSLVTPTPGDTQLTASAQHAAAFAGPRVCAFGLVFLVQDLKEHEPHRVLYLPLI